MPNDYNNTKEQLQKHTGQKKRRKTSENRANIIKTHQRADEGRNDGRGKEKEKSTMMKQNETNLNRQRENSIAYIEETKEGNKD